MIEKRRKNPNLALNFINKLYAMAEKRKKHVALPTNFSRSPAIPKNTWIFKPT